jgi:hypothetical protein
MKENKRTLSKIVVCRPGHHRQKPACTRPHESRNTASASGRSYRLLTFSWLAGPEPSRSLLRLRSVSLCRPGSLKRYYGWLRVILFLFRCSCSCSCSPPSPSATSRGTEPRPPPTQPPLGDRAAW